MSSDTTPMTGAGAPVIFTPEYYARMRALEATSWWNAGMRDIAARLLARVGLPERGTLLDVGCGSGQTMGWFAAKYPGWRCAGIDVAREGLTAARASGATAVSLASALELPFASGSVDLVITFDVLQHLPLDGGDERALREIARVLRPRGTLLIRTNAQAFPHTPDDPVFAFHKYEPSELRVRLRGAGFEVLRLGRVNALLGLAEIPRELRARRGAAHAYHGLLAEPRPQSRIVARMKRAWLGAEGRVLCAGGQLPLGRTILALARKP